MSARQLLPAFVTLGVLACTLTSARDARAQDAFGGATYDEKEQPSPTPEAAPTNEPALLDDLTRVDDDRVRVQPRRTPGPLAVRFDGGYAMRRLFQLGVTGADLGFGLGAQTSHHFAVWWATRVSIGSTDNGLSVWSGRTGAEIEGVFDPVRFGVGTSLLMIGVTRAVRDETLYAYGFEARAFVRVDAWRTEDFALFLRAAIDGGVDTASGSAFWGPVLGAGVELGVRGQRPAAWTASTPPVIPRL